MRDLAELLDPALPLPIAGKEYRVECSAWHGLHLHHLITTGAVLTDAEELVEITAMLGPVYDEMLADGVPWSKISHAGRTAMFWFGHSPELGQRIWESGGVSGNPIPPSPNQRAMGEKLRSLFGRSPSASARGRAGAR